MKQKMETSIIHRRASSDGVYNRMSAQKESGIKEAQQMRRLNRQQQDLMNAVKEAIRNEDKFTKKQRIRIMQWSEKLSTRPNNIVWRKNIIFYLKALVEMINQQEILAPFSNMPAQGPLPNLKLLDLPFPIRERLVQKDKGKNQIQSKIKSKQGSVQKVHHKAKSINFNQDLKLDMSSINNSNTNAVKNRKKSQFQSYQASEKRADNKENIAKLRLKLTADHNKQNDSHLSNNANITRRLFDKQTVNEKTLLTYNNNQECLQVHNTTVCSFEGLDQTNRSQKHRGMSLLLKVYELINKNADLDDDQQAKSVCSTIHRIADQMGVSLSNNTLNESNISSSSSHFRKASENIRLKFVQTDEQTLQFMSFLHKFRVKNQ